MGNKRFELNHSNVFANKDLSFKRLHKTSNVPIDIKSIEIAYKQLNIHVIRTKTMIYKINNTSMVLSNLFSNV